MIHFAVSAVLGSAYFAVLWALMWRRERLYQHLRYKLGWDEESAAPATILASMIAGLVAICMAIFWKDYDKIFPIMVGLVGVSIAVVVVFRWVVWGIDYIMAVKEKLDETKDA
jgi:VIT1/CCC1 family predicted Fe2+/Mn2+ transporter